MWVWATCGLQSCDRFQMSFSIVGRGTCVTETKGASTGCKIVSKKKLQRVEQFVGWCGNKRWPHTTAMSCLSWSRGPMMWWVGTLNVRCQLEGSRLNTWRPSQLCTQLKHNFKTFRKESLKKIRLERNWSPWPCGYRNWAIKPTVAKCIPIGELQM